MPLLILGVAAAYVVGFLELALLIAANVTLFRYRSIRVALFPPSLKKTFQPMGFLFQAH